MSNPWLSTFAAPYAHPSTHDIRDETDPDYVDIDDDDDWGQFTRGHDFGRWRTPGASTIRVPVKQGPVFAPGQTPSDVINAEVVSPQEQDAADKIINGEHDSASPSENPHVEQAREDLHGPGADDTVSTLSGLLRGGRPEDVGGMDEAHDWLSRHFTGVRVNPHHGTLLAQSPAGTQIVRRQQHFPAIPQPNMTQATYTLTNKHGDFESDDPRRIVRSMIAFQIVHNAIAAEQKKKDDEDNGLATTSGFWSGLAGGIAGGLGKLVDATGITKDWKGPEKPKPRTDVPHGAVWEAGLGNEVNHTGQQGGWVVRAADAPPGWLHAGGTAYSPGHAMRLMLDPVESTKPRPDPRFSGHTFTYAPSPETGHTEPRRNGNVNYWVQPDIHPAARGAGFDTIPATPPPPAAGRGTIPRPAPRRPPHSRRPGSGGEIGGSGSPPYGGPVPPPKTSAVQTNDLCPVCASGYLESYDNEFHECLNCGSLVKHVGFEKHAARPKGGLGRGLGQIIDPGASAVGMGLNDDGSAKEVGAVDLDETQTQHPLADEQLPEDFEGYQAPRNLGIKQAGADEVDDFLGKQGFFPVHRSGQSRTYVHPIPGVDGAYFRLTEGVPNVQGQPSGWALTADKTRRPSGQTFKVMSPGGMKDRSMPEVTDRAMPEKSFLAGGAHPVDDDALNRAIRDVHENGRTSETYRRLFEDAAYEPPSPAPRGSTQRAKRHLSSVENPGLTRFVS